MTFLLYVIAVMIVGLVFQKAGLGTPDDTTLLIIAILCAGQAIRDKIPEK